MSSFTSHPPQEVWSVSNFENSLSPPRIFFPWSKLHSKQGNDGEPSPASFSYERPPSRAAARDAAQSISSADSADSFWGGAAVVGGSGAE